MSTELSPNLSTNPICTTPILRRIVPISYLNRTRPYQGRGDVESSVIWSSTGTIEYGLGMETSSAKVLYFIRINIQSL